MNLRTQLARLKRKLFKKPFLKDQQYPPYWFQKVLGDKPASVVQIGSNDGKTGDPLHTLLYKNKQWNALFVEPVPYLFDRLKANYSNPERFRFENAAVGAQEQLTFYWVDPKAKDHLPDLPYWYDQLGSFNKQHIVEQLDGVLEPFILSNEVESITLQSLLSRHQVIQLDILHIDTEGHDWKILSQLNQETHTPKFILYEANHLSKNELQESIRFLQNKYVLFEIGIDVLAVLKDQEQLDLAMMRKFMNPLTLTTDEPV